MFDIGFSELIVIAIVALVVVGPERLPKVARTAGHLLGRLQRYVNDVKSDISREMQLDELKKLQSEMQESARNFQHSIDSEIQALEPVAAPLHAVAGELREALAPSAETIGRAVTRTAGETGGQVAGEMVGEATVPVHTPGAPGAKA